MTGVVRVISSYAVRAFIKAGGTVRYRPARDANGRYWEVFCVDQDGHEVPVVIARSGEPKILRSADGVVNYHKSMFPEVREVTVPLPEDEPAEDTPQASPEKPRSTAAPRRAKPKRRPAVTVETDPDDTDGAPPAAAFVGKAPPGTGAIIPVKAPTTYDTDQPEVRKGEVWIRRKLSQPALDAARGHFDPFEIEAAHPFGRMVATAALAVYFDKENKI